MVENKEEPRFDFQETFIEFLRPYGTTLILIVNVILFAILEATGGPTTENLIRFGARYSPAIWNGEYWRFFSSIFLHVDLWHLLLNGACLIIIGQSMERGILTSKYLTVYFLSGLTGGILSDAIGFDLSVGSSGAIYGILGGGLVLSIVEAGGVRKSLNHTTTLYVILFLLLGMMLSRSAPLADGAAHVGGFAGGTLAMIYIARRYIRGIWRRRLMLTVCAAGFVCLGGLIARSVALNFNATHLAQRGFLYLQVTADVPDARRIAFDYVERSLALEPGNPLAHHALAIFDVRGGGERELKPAIARSVHAVETRETRLLEDGTRLFAGGKYPEAIAAFSRVLKIDPENPIARVCRGIARVYENDNLDAARSDLEAIVKEGESEKPDWYDLKSLFSRSGSSRPEDAYRDLAEYAMARIHFKSNQPDRALQIVARSTVSSSRYWSLQMESYRDAVARGDVKTASAALENLGSLGAQLFDSVSRLNNQAYLYAECEIRLSEALNMAAEAVQANADPGYIDTLGWVYLKLGDYDSALHHLRAAASRSESGILHYHYAEALRLHPSHNFKEAASQYRIAIHSGELDFHEYEQAKRGLADVLTAAASM